MDYKRIQRTDKYIDQKYKYIDQKIIKEFA
jgi:hypothetical protein